MPRVFVGDVRIGDASVPLAEDDAHHLRHVLRLKPGEAVGVFDGRGHEWRGVVGTSDRRGVVVDQLAAVAPVPEPPVRVILGVALLKGEQMDYVVRDATAMGASAIAPFGSAHVAVPERARRHDAAHARWTRVAIAAARQCGRAVVPSIAPVARLVDLLTGTAASLTLMAVEPGAGPVEDVASLPVVAEVETALVLVGPEGGWSAEEIEAAGRGGARFVHVGPRTLRAETAPVVLLSALWTRWGW